jgi:hypothetical protein
MLVRFSPLATNIDVGIYASVKFVKSISGGVV